MVKLPFTNIIIDQFSTARCNPFNKYVHFLSHTHMDHLKGLSNSWDYGLIYCSALTKQLLLLKYPRLSCLKQLQLDKQHTIALSSQLEITATLFDSNHCAGGIMILFQGYMGNILYSGDMRYNRQIFEQYNYLYPNNKRNKQFKNCSISIDTLYLDTTFLHPKFTFPSKSQALKQLDTFISTTIQSAKQKSEFVQFYIGIDSFGKEQVLVHLAQKFQTLITVTEDRYKIISTIKSLEPAYFTTDPQAGFIHVMLKRQLKQAIKNKQNAVGIILTGWANKSHFRASRLYAIPYSLHSSYPELVAFVDSIRPSFIESILQSQTLAKPPVELSKPSNNQYQNKNDYVQLYEEVDTSEYLAQLRNQFTREPTIEMKMLQMNVDFQKKIKQKLKLDRSTTQINRDEFGITNSIARVENISRAGAKLTKFRDQEEIQKVKVKLKNKKQQIKNKLFVIKNQKNQAKLAKRNGIVPLRSSSSAIEIDGSIQNSNDNQQKFSHEKNCPNLNHQNHQNYEQFKQIQKNWSVSEDSLLTRKYKWEKKIESGEIDLFGNVPVTGQKSTQANSQLCKPITNSFLLQTNKYQVNKFDKNLHKTPQIIEIVDQDFNFNKNRPQCSNSNSHTKRKKQTRTVNSDKIIYTVMNIENDILPQLPAERQPNQRSIIEFFKKPFQNKLQNEQEKASNQLMSEKGMQADDEEDSLAESQEIVIENEQVKRQNFLKDCQKFSIFSLRIDHLDQIKEATAEDYKNFYVQLQK